MRAAYLPTYVDGGDGIPTDVARREGGEERELHSGAEWSRGSDRRQRASSTRSRVGARLVFSRESAFTAVKVCGAVLVLESSRLVVNHGGAPGRLLTASTRGSRKLRAPS